MNLVLERGHLVRDVELKIAPNTGMAIAKFTVAVPAMKKDSPASFIPCVAFGKTAELISEKFQKGSPIYFSGHLQSGSYINKDEKKIYTLEVIIERFEYIDKLKADEFKEEEYIDIGEMDGDIPF